MYEQMYGELEKVRNMLVVEYEMNKKLMEEKTRQSEEHLSERRRLEIEVETLKAELSKCQQNIQTMETQLETIASGFPIGSEIFKQNPIVRSSDSDLTLRFQKLRFTDLGIRNFQTAKPTVFFVVEFFDFEFQISPLFVGPESEIDYAVVFEIVVSDLLLHYITKDGINVEIYKTVGLSHELVGSAQISLKPLLSTKTPTKLTGNLEFKKEEKVIAIVDYYVDIPFELSKSLQKQKRKQMAATYLPADSTIPDFEYNDLRIWIRRCHNLDSLFSSNRPIYIAYQLFGLPPHSTNLIVGNNNPEIDDDRSYTLPVCDSLDQYLKAENLMFMFVEDESPASSLGSVSIPLFSLARNQQISASFPISKPDESLSSATVEISISWKFPYTFKGGDLEVKRLEEPTKATESKPPKPPVTNQPIPTKRQKPNSPKEEKTQQKEEPRKPEEEEPREPKEPQKEEEETPRAESTETPTQIESIQSTSDEDAESVIVVGSPELESERTPKLPEPKPRTHSLDPNDLSNRLSKVRDYDPDIDGNVEVLDVYSSESSSNATFTPENPSELSIEKPKANNEEEKRPQPIRRSNLGNLPPLNIPVAAPRQQQPHRNVEFTEPLHSSIPPSESSSFAEMSEDSTHELRPNRPRRLPPPLNPPTNPSALRFRTQNLPADETIVDNAVVWLRIQNLTLLDHSSLLAVDYDNAQCFIEWSFLDFPPEECETPNSIPLPRSHRQVAEFLTENVYELNWCRIALLRQWMSLGTRLKFMLVLDFDGDNKRLEDVAEGSLDLQSLIDSTHHLVTLSDIDLEPLATLELEMELADPLWGYFDELAER